MSMKNLLSAVLVALCAAFVVACASTPVLDSPRQINVPAVASVDDVEQAVLDSMRARGWAVHERSAGQIVADLHVRSHFARVDIRYDANRVSLAYVDSRNLNYERVGGTEHIHSNFNSWMGNLAGDIQRHLSYIE